MFVAARVALLGLALALLTIDGSAVRVQPPPDLDAFARKVREVIRLEYADPIRFNYIEEGRDVDISMFGKVSVGPLQTFEVRQNPPGEAWRRLVAIDGKPLAAAELARRDAEHERDMRRKAEREQSETPRQRAARLKKEADELRERDEILDDAERVFAFTFVVARERRWPAGGRRRSDAAAEGDREDQRRTADEAFAGRLWVCESDYRLARVRLHAIDSVSVGWGVVAKVERGSGFDFVRKKVAGAWVASQLTIEGTGNTLLFRSFAIKTVTTYTDHRPLRGGRSD